MKRKISYSAGKKTISREITYIPFRYIFAFFITFLEVILMIGTVVLLCYYVPYFYILAYVTELGCVIQIISSDDAPDYKVPWLLFVLLLPIVGFMLYFIFYSRKLKKKYIKRLNYLNSITYHGNDRMIFSLLEKTDTTAFLQAKMICKLSGSNLFSFTNQKYYPLGELLYKDLLIDLKNAKRFIYLEYFIIEDGEFWQSILKILKEKAQDGVDVKIVYDDIGCICTLPGNFSKILSKYKISAVPFSRLKGNADNEFNNRSHRKIAVIDGYIGYTGGINIADEYINKKERFGHWKDVGLRLEGPAVMEFTKLFITDFGINVKLAPQFPASDILFPISKTTLSEGFIVPFGDGPKPVFKRRVSKSIIQCMVENAKEFCHIITPYLIIDSSLCSSLETAALKGVDVKIILPHIPDKKITFSLSRSYYERLISAGVKIYEYKKGFVHAKLYLTDNDYALIGTVNLDYRSLVHHFENAVYLYNAECIKDMNKDFNDTLNQCLEMTASSVKLSPIKRFFRSIVKIFAPLF